MTMNLHLPLPAQRHGMPLLLALLILPVAARRADFRLVKVRFDVNEAKYSATGEYLGEFPKEDVKIAIRPDRWTDGPRSRPGVSRMAASGSAAPVEGLITEVPNSLPHGQAMGHLELVGPQPWGTEEKFLLWQHGYGRSKHDQPFAVDTHQPQKAILVPVEHLDDYYRTRVLAFKDSEFSRRYFSSLVDFGMLGVEFTPEGQSTAMEFALRQKKVIQDAASYWKVDTRDITEGFDRWQIEVAASPSNTVGPKEKALALAYAGNLPQAAVATQMLIQGRPVAEAAEAVWLNARVNITLGRDILAKEGGRFPASGSREERLTQAIKAFKDAKEGVDKLKTPGVPESPVNIETRKSLDKILNNWSTPLSPPSGSIRVFNMPATE